MLPPTAFSFKNCQQNKTSSASAFVEGSLNDLRANKSTSNVDLYLSSNCCQLGRHVSEADVLLQKGGGTPRRYFSHALFRDDNFLIVSRNSSICYLKSDESSLNAFFFLPGQHRSTDESALIVCNQSRLFSSKVVVSLMTVERHSSFVLTCCVQLIRTAIPRCHADGAYISILFQSVSFIRKHRLQNCSPVVAKMRNDTWYLTLP